VSGAASRRASFGRSCAPSRHAVRQCAEQLQSAPAGGPGMVSWLGGACRRLLSGDQPAIDMFGLQVCPVTAEDMASYQGAHTACLCFAGMQNCCLCLRQGTNAATKEGDARPRAELEAQARSAAAARTEADRDACENNTTPVLGAMQPGAQREAWAARAAPSRAAGRHGAASVWVPAERGRSVSGAAAAPGAGAGRTGVPVCGQRGARARETGPAYTMSGGPGRTATPAPPPIYARAGAMWPRV